jgi:hypothetical protein
MLLPKITGKISFVTFFILCFQLGFTQINDPLSRIGLGSLTPNSNQALRSMGGVTTAIGSTTSNFTFVNPGNPASYAFLAYKKQSKVLGRTILDLGVDYQSNTLQNKTGAKSYNSKYLEFSYLNLGIPIDTPSKFGMSLGIMPYSNIGYNITNRAVEPNALNGNAIDTCITNFEGDGGSYKAYIGFGGRIGDLSLGFNTGYFFGKKNFSTKKVFDNDTILYYPGNFTNKVNFGNLFFEFGALYTKQLKPNTNLTLGATIQLANKLNANRDIVKETFRVNTDTEQLDSLDRIFVAINQKGKINLPGKYSFGVAYERNLSEKQDDNRPAYLISLQYDNNQFKDFSFYNTNEGLVNSGTIRVGGYFFNPYARGRNKKNSRLSTFIYRVGYANTQNYGGFKNVSYSAFTFGLGVPLSVPNYFNNELSFLNISLEYGRKSTPLSFNENIFRIGVGFSLSDIWFRKRRYD